MRHYKTHLSKRVIDLVVTQLQEGKEYCIYQEDAHPFKNYCVFELFFKESVTPNSSSFVSVYLRNTQ